VPRLMLSIVTFSFVVYLIPGLFGAPLKALAGYLPPMHTHDFNVPLLIAQQQSTNREALLTRTDGESEALCAEPEYADLLHFPHGIQGYFDYDQALACAQAQNKPLFIDFTGHGCVNCREMEARVWSDPAVLQRLKEDFVVVALYVDEKTELPESEWYTSEYDGKVKKTMGKQNADFQIRRFNNNAQPYYVLLNNQGELLAEPKAYDLSVPNFVKFLELGKKRFAAGETVDDPALARR
jgi:thioredoxin-related protein